MNAHAISYMAISLIPSSSQLESTSYPSLLNSMWSKNISITVSSKSVKARPEIGSSGLLSCGLMPSLSIPRVGKTLQVHPDRKFESFYRSRDQEVFSQCRTINFEYTQLCILLLTLLKTVNNNSNRSE